MQKLLVTGSRGQLGRDCLDVFGDLTGVTGADLPEIDLTDKRACLDLLDRVHPEYIVNCAAYTAVDACETDPSCWKANAELPGFLAKWVEANNSFLVHVSTDYVFPGKRPLYEASVETDPVAPVSEYGRSKLAGERAIRECTERYAILRTAWLYGAHGKNFLKTMLRLTLQHPDRTFKVVNDQFGSPTWSFTLARQIRAVIEARAAGLFHASSEGYCTWHELACTFLDELGIKHHFEPCTTEEFPSLTKRPANSILENAHAIQLGINVFRDWREELSAFVELHGDDLLTEVRSFGSP